MNLEKIKILSEKKKITLTDLSSKINMSYQNLNRCIRENKMQAQDLEKICNILDVPISYFFEQCEDETQKVAIKHNAINGNNNQIQIKLTEQSHEIEKLKKEIEYLKEIIKQKEELINLLKELKK